MNLNNDFTLEDVRTLIRSGTDDTHTQLRVSLNGDVYLSKVIGNIDTEGLAFRLETWIAENGYVGHEAALDEKWIARLFTCLKDNWPNPISDYIDIY